jgi:hypothetical protein
MINFMSKEKSLNNPSVDNSFTMDLLDGRGWIFYSLISLVALLWAGFIYQQGVMLWVSFFITLTVLGTSVLLLIFLCLDSREKAQDKKQA